MRLAGLLALLGCTATSATLVALAVPGLGQVPSASLEPGSSTMTELALPDPDLRLVVGHARAPAVLGLALGPAPSRVLAVPAEAPQDLGPLEATGRAFPFTDPHGHDWVVREYRAAWGWAYGVDVGPLDHDERAGAYNYVLLVDQSRTGSAVRVVAG